MTEHQERYITLLLAKAEAQEQPDPALLDRIERALGIVAATVRVSPRKPSLRAVPPVPRIQQVIDLVAARYGVDPAEMVGPGRKQPATAARQIAMRLARELTGASYPEIGRMFNRDHATVMHACEVTAGMALGDIREELTEAFAASSPVAIPAVA